MALAGLSAAGAENPAAAQFHQDIQPLLKEYCYDCHGDGAKKGDIAFDELKTDDAVLNPDLWFKVLKNTRAGLMPPQKKSRPSPEEQQKIEHWIKYAAFGLDPNNPDPGRVTVRRLNRVEYRNTIHDLMGIDFNTDAEFPPDDTGYGFDNIGDVLTVSPMLLEKYLASAATIVAEAVPTVEREIPEQTIAGNHFHRTDAKPAGDDARGRGGDNAGRPNRFGGGRPILLSYYEPAAVSGAINVDQAGTYVVALDLQVKGAFEFDPGRCHVLVKLDGHELVNKDFGWYDSKTFHFESNEKWTPGEHQLTLDLKPLTAAEDKVNNLDMSIAQVTVRGPMEKEHWARPKNFDRFFTKDAPERASERRAYARELLGNFATKAFRRPVDSKTADRLAKLAEGVYTQPGNTFEAGVAQAMVAVLSSPRFLFRLEQPADATARSAVAYVDEYSLASRLSYFLWSTMPDDELMRLAGRGELRKNLPAQIQRMLADPRSEKLVENFTGQWLQTRDVEGISINAQVILARDSGTEKQLRDREASFRAQFAQDGKPPAPKNQPASGLTNQPASGLTNIQAALGGLTNTLAQTNSGTQSNALAQQKGLGKRRFMPPPRPELEHDVRVAMRQETEMFFANIIHEDRPITDLIDSDYTFLNEKLAKFYGITNVTGTEMRKVTLPSDSVRGGVLTEGSALVVTSNPDRTSPVKRGLFILDNFLGAPTPPPPPNIPSLEVAENAIQGHEPTLRESLQMHRDKPLCASCHGRMDPIGLAFENFNAMGMWRDKERSQTIDPSGKLITGESFKGVKELKHILATDRREDFYRCLTEKLLTYALGRGPEYYDVETIDQIVQRLDRENGHFSALVNGIIESAPFQKMRTQAIATASDDRRVERATAGQIAQNER